MVLFNLESTNILKDGWQNNTWIREYRKNAAVSGKRIGNAMLVIQGAVDPIMYPGSVTDESNETLKADPSASTEYHLLFNISHAPAMYAGLQIYLDWIAATILQAAPKTWLLKIRPATLKLPSQPQYNGSRQIGSFRMRLSLGRRLELEILGRESRGK